MLYYLNRTTQIFSLTACLAILPATAGASLLYESNDASGAPDFQAANGGLLSVFEVSARTELTSFAIELSLSEPGDLNFVVFDWNSENLLYESGAKSFSTESLSFKQSDTFSLFLETDTRYALGAIANVGARFNYAGYSSEDPGRSENGIFSLRTNQNVSGFADPLFGSTGSVEVRTQIFGNQNFEDENPPAVSVPEPGTLALLSLGLIGICVKCRKGSN